MSKHAISAVIQPDVGRHVHYYPAGQDVGFMVRHGAQPLHAVVLYVHNERAVNLQIVDHHGHTHTRTGVVLVQPADAYDEGVSHCKWTPHQAAQAAPRLVLTEADALADLNGTPRPDNPGAPTGDGGGISPVLAGLIESTPTSLKPSDLAGIQLTGSEA